MAKSSAAPAQPQIELLHAAMDESDDLARELTNLKALALKLARAVRNEVSKGTIVLDNEANWLLDDIEKAAAPAPPRQTDEELLKEYVEIWENCTDQPIAPESRAALRKIIESRKHL